MKNILKNLGILIMIVISVYYANALATDKTSLMIGSTSTEASNILRGVSYDVYSTTDIAFTTADHIELYDVVTFNGFNQNTNSSLKNNINVTATEKTFDGSTKTVLTIKGRIPEGLDAVDDRGKPTSEEVAELRFREVGNHSNTASVRLSMQRSNHLEMKKLTLTYGEDETLKLTDGKKIDEMKAGESGTVEYQIENTFSNSDDLEIDDIIIYMKDAGNDLDIDEDQDMDSIPADDDDKDTLSFDLPDDLDEDTYPAYLYVVGYDTDYHARHGEFYTVHFKIDKENNEVTIKRIAIEPNTVDLCQQSTAVLTVTIENTGSRRQKEAAMSIASPALVLGTKVTDIELDSGDSKTKTLPITLSKDAKAGNYPIVVRSYYDTDSMTDERTVYLYVTSCKTVPGTEEETDDDSEAGNDNEEVEVVDISGGKQPSKTEQTEEKLDSNVITPKTLVLAIIALLLFIVVVVMALTSRRR